MVINYSGFHLTLQIERLVTQTVYSDKGKNLLLSGEDVTEHVYW